MLEACSSPIYRTQTKAATLIQDVLYADDLTLIAEARSELQHMLDALDGACSHWSMTINGEKTKVLTVGDHPEAADQTPITLQNRTLEDVTTFSYLGSQVQQTGEGSGHKDRESWDSVPDLVTKSLSQLYSLSRHTKMRVFRTLVMLILLYGAETWPVTNVCKTY